MDNHRKITRNWNIIPCVSHLRAGLAWKPKDTKKYTKAQGLPLYMRALFPRKLDNSKLPQEKAI